MASVLILAYSGEERTGVSNAYRYLPPQRSATQAGTGSARYQMEKESIRLTPVARKNLAGGSYARFGAEFWPQTNALLHVDDVAVLGEPVNESGRQVSVLQKRAPLGEAQIGSDQSRLFAMAFMHQGEEKPHLDRFNLYIANARSWSLLAL